MGNPAHPGFADDENVELSRLLYASSHQAAGPTSAFQPLSTRKIDAGVTRMINARFNHKADGPA